MTDTTHDPLPATVRIGFFSRLRRFAPAIGFFGGFAWDAITLGRSITPLDLFILLGYYVGAAVILFLLGRQVRNQPEATAIAATPGNSRMARWLRGVYSVTGGRAAALNFALQFLIGGIFSALVVFYFLSSSNVAALFVVAALVALLVANEFQVERHKKLALSWTMFAIAGIMFFNFALPHLFRSISPFWFYLSTMVALLTVGLLRGVSAERWISLSPAAAAGVLLLALHFFNLIPPVPLVQKKMVIAHDVDKRNGGYTVSVERRGLTGRGWLSGPDIHLQPGGRLYCFTSVFLPSGIETTIRHRWQRLDAASGDWITVSTVPFRITGGRKGGYRGYSFKSNVSPGRWRVLTESESGAAVGVVRFRVLPATKPVRMKKLRL
jgi:hypothetical protein